MSKLLFVVTTILAFSNPAKSFVDPALHRGGKSTGRQQTELQVSESSTNRASLIDDDRNDPMMSSIDRRALLLSGASMAGTYFFLTPKLSGNSPAILTSLESTMDSSPTEPLVTTVASVDEALKLIESRGDKRFLHAVVASDYQFLYEQSETVPSDIDSKEIFSKKVPSAKNNSKTIHLAATGNLRTAKSSSLWPLGMAMNSSSGSSDIHYAWPEQGGSLEPNLGKDGAPISMALSQQMIVDGIDCGKMSLEDALEGNMQVLVLAPTFLSVPSHMESSLRKGLQEAFLI